MHQARQSKTKEIDAHTNNLLHMYIYLKGFKCLKNSKNDSQRVQQHQQYIVLEMSHHDYKRFTFLCSFLF